jgi:hypothetical protein
MKIKRRHFLMFLGMSIGAACTGRPNTPVSQDAIGKTTGLSFQPIFGPMPLDVNQINVIEQAKSFSTYEVMDDLILPEGFSYDVIAAWGDKLGDSRVGYNNDYLSFIPTSENEGYLTANFEYISGKTWMQTYEQVIGKSLPFAEVIQALKDKKGKIDAYSLPENNPLKKEIRQISLEALEDQGMGVMFLRRDNQGKWQRVPSPGERRISGIAGLKGHYLKATGPAVTIFHQPNKQGYDDNLGAKIVGTFANCAGVTSPWGTVFSAEENFQDQVPEPVYADGSSFAPGERPFVISGDIDGQGNVLGLAGNKYGWMVEVDPANPNDYGTKHTWLGRYRHEAVAFLAVDGKPLAVYSGCDRRGGHFYKFVSKGIVSHPKDKANSALMNEGMLYAAVFEPGGKGRWLPLSPETPVNPVMPSTVAGGMVLLPQRPEGGIFEIKKDQEAIAFKQKYKTLGDLYNGNPQEKQGAILIDAHFAANAAGATCTARPEDSESGTDGTIYIAFTSGSPGGDGGPDLQIFSGSNGEPWEYGWIMSLKEDENNPSSLTFQWDMLAMGGEPADGGAGFSNPDNVMIDPANNVWMVTDISTDKHNNPQDKKRQGCFGNNSIWHIATTGENAGNAYLFGIGPMDCEMTGLFFTPDQKTLFLSVQHPGEQNGIRQNSASETRDFVMKTTDGQEFTQKRLVPIGSNWPSKQENDPPRPAIIAVRRLNSETIT